jgi:hypothetical protein
MNSPRYMRLPRRRFRFSCLRSLPPGGPEKELAPSKSSRGPRQLQTTRRGRVRETAASGRTSAAIPSRTRCSSVKSRPSRLQLPKHGRSFPPAALPHRGAGTFRAVCIRSLPRTRALRRQEVPRLRQSDLLVLTTIPGLWRARTGLRDGRAEPQYRQLYGGRAKVPRFVYLMQLFSLSNTVCHDRKWIAASKTVDLGGNRPA